MGNDGRGIRACGRKPTIAQKDGIICHDDRKALARH
jgi:hypothetical protein